MEEMTLELTLVGECEVQLTSSGGRETACAKPLRSRRLEGWVLRLSGVSGGPCAFQAWASCSRRGEPPRMLSRIVTELGDVLERPFCGTLAGGAMTRPELSE